MTLGASAAYSSVENINQSDQEKFMSLRDIQTIRETKKNEIVSSIFGETSGSNDKLAVIPGRASVISVPIQNDSDFDQVFSITFRDSEDGYLPKDSKRAEFFVPSTPEEQANLVAKGLWKRTQRWNEISRHGDINLKGRQQFDCPIVFFTTRDASHATNVQPSDRITKQH